LYYSIAEHKNDYAIAVHHYYCTLNANTFPYIQDAIRNLPEPSRFEVGFAITEIDVGFALQTTKFPSVSYEWVKQWGAKHKCDYLADRSSKSHIAFLGGDSCGDFYRSWFEVT
jgi:hypothetical protein